jgi:hypothetical protein
LEAIGNKANQEAKRAAKLPYPHIQATVISYLNNLNPVYDIQVLLSQRATWKQP